MWPWSKFNDCFKLKNFLKWLIVELIICPPPVYRDLKQKQGSWKWRSFMSSNCCRQRQGPTSRTAEVQWPSTVSGWCSAHSPYSEQSTFVHVRLHHSLWTARWIPPPVILASSSSSSSPSSSTQCSLGVWYFFDWSIWFCFVQHSSALVAPCYLWCHQHTLCVAVLHCSISLNFQLSFVSEQLQFPPYMQHAMLTKADTIASNYHVCIFLLQLWSKHAVKGVILLADSSCGTHLHSLGLESTVE